MGQEYEYISGRLVALTWQGAGPEHLAQDIQAQLLVTPAKGGKGKLSHFYVRVRVQGQQQLLHPAWPGRHREGRALGWEATGWITAAHSECFSRLIEERMVA